MVEPEHLSCRVVRTIMAMAKKDESAAAASSSSSHDGGSRESGPVAAGQAWWLKCVIKGLDLHLFIPRVHSYGSVSSKVCIAEESAMGFFSLSTQEIETFQIISVSKSSYSN